MSKVVNSTVLSNFAAANRLDILHDLTGMLYLPSEVYDEIVAGQLAGYAFYDDIEQHIAPLSQQGWLHLVSLAEAELHLMAALPDQLHRGEAACLCVARQRGWDFLSDDRAARRQAEKWNIPVSGTLGILVTAIQQSRLSPDAANAVLRTMIDRANYRTPVTDLRLLL
jgi:predicted nucleic acid-binding protein